MEKYNSFTDEDSSCQKIDLHKNFRSRKEVLDFANEVFFHTMDRDIGNVAYDKKAALYPGASYCEENDPKIYRTEMLGIVREDGDEERVELEARIAAQKIKEITGEKTGDSWCPEYRDIVILVHALKGWGETFVKVFSREGIPLVTTSRSGYFSAPEVQTMIQMLRVLDNMRQDIPLTAVLSSRIGNFSADELAFIRTAYPDLLFHECFFCWNAMTMEQVKQLWENQSDREKALNIRKKTADFIKMIEEFREMSKDMPIHLLIQKIYDRTGYLDYVTYLHGGGQRRAIWICFWKSD